MPKTARIATATIWTTAKFTEVNRRQRRMPACARRLGPVRPSGRPAARPIVRLVKESGSDPGRNGRSRSRRGERLLEVGDQVGNVLEPDAHPEEPGRDAALDELGLRQLALRRRRRVDDHRVHAAERGGELGQSEGVDDGPAGGPPAGELKGEHPAAVARPELPLGDGSLRVAGETRVVDPLHAALTLEPGGECQRVRRVAVHPYGEREQAAKDQEGLERPEGPARVDL